VAPSCKLPLEAGRSSKISPRVSAENGRQRRRALNIVTKSGTNQFPGALYGFFRLQALQTNKTPSANRPDSPNPIQPSTIRRSIGGPSAKKGDFGFFATKAFASVSRFAVTISNTGTHLASRSAQFMLTPSLPHSMKTIHVRTAASIHLQRQTKRCPSVHRAQDKKRQNDSPRAQVDTKEGGGQTTPYNDSF